MTSTRAAEDSLQSSDTVVRPDERRRAYVTAITPEAIDEGENAEIVAELIGSVRAEDEEHGATLFRLVNPEFAEALRAFWKDVAAQ
jgi:hypothetical protein